MKVAPRFGWKLRLTLALSEWLTRVGIMPTVPAIIRWPVARRKSIKPAGWMTYPPPASVLTARESIATAAGPMDLKVVSYQCGASAVDPLHPRRRLGQRRGRFA